MGRRPLKMCSPQTHRHKCKHSDRHNCIPHCDCPAQLVTQTVGPSKVPFRGDGGSRGGGGEGSDRGLWDSNKEHNEDNKGERMREETTRGQRAGTRPAAWPHLNLSECVCVRSTNHAQRLLNSDVTGNYCSMKLLILQLKLCLCCNSIQS